MTSKVGLYYPFIHFRDPAWLKVCALYWDGMKRIVPEGVTLRDSDDVNALKDIGFVQDESPTMGLGQVEILFDSLFESYGSRLAQNLSIDNREDWPEDSHSLFHSPPRTDPRLAYVFGQKLPPNLLNRLYSHGMATSRIGDPRWIGMHPRFASVYMTTLAEQLALRVGANPVTDDQTDHIAMSGARWTGSPRSSWTTPP